jgi:eukaryotic-like serine/threonine-protein kinase
LLVIPARRTSTAEPHTKEPERVGPYTLYGEIGVGGMASVHLGQLRSASGFTRVVAIKRMHAELARSPEFVAMFFDEARLVGRIQHPNVVSALDCVVCDGAILLVMDYVHGVSLDQAQRVVAAAAHDIPLPIASAILIGALLGLHAAHEAVGENGANLGIVHRDVSPHNILVGVDGLARVLDFGIAKAAERAHHTRTGEVKGKLGYMSPEQLFNETIGREADVYSVGVVLWELLMGRRLFANDTQAQKLMRVANNQIESPRSLNPLVAPEVEAVVMKALAKSPQDRYRTALEFAADLESAIPPAPQRVVGDWLAHVARDPLLRRLGLRSGIAGASSIQLRNAGGGPAVNDEVTSRFRLPEGAMVETTEDPVFLLRPKRPWGLFVLVALLGAAAGVTGMLAGPRLSVATKTQAAAVRGPEATVGPAPAVEPASNGVTPTADLKPPTPAGHAAVATATAPGTASPPAVSAASPLGYWSPARAAVHVHPVKPVDPAGSVSTPASASSVTAHPSDLDSIGGRE